VEIPAQARSTASPKPASRTGKAHWFLSDPTSSSLQSLGDKAVTSGNACSPDNFRAYSPQTSDNDRPQPDIPLQLEGPWGTHVAVRRACRSPAGPAPRRFRSGTTMTMW
jgi:hypothetical protein